MKPNLIEILIQQKQLNTEAKPRKARKCPICPGIDLVPADRQGVEIDWCPKCRGVWLDCGELERIIERSAPRPMVPHIHKESMLGNRSADDHFRHETDYHNHQNSMAGVAIADHPNNS